MTLSGLLGLEVTTESGGRIGRVHDVRAELTRQSLNVIGLVVGRVGVFERLGLGAPESSARVRSRDFVPWAAVVRVDSRGVVIRDGTEPLRD